MPIGPTWNLSHYFLGADEIGRDVAVRLLYGGRNSLEIGFVAMLITMVFGTHLGHHRRLLPRRARTSSSAASMDVIWAYPAVLLGITLGTVINIRGLGPFLHSTTLMTTALVVGFVYIPYVVRPIRAQVLTLREREFVDAARQQGLSKLPDHVRRAAAEPVVDDRRLHPADPRQRDPPRGRARLPRRRRAAPHTDLGHDDPGGPAAVPGRVPPVLIPGIMLVLTVMSVNIFGDGVRDALDPRPRPAGGES